MRQASRSIWIALLAMLLVQPAAAQTAEANERVFDRAWSLVQRRYFDPELKGLDWEATAERFRPRARTATDERALYGAINAMLDTLGDSHVYATPPSRWREMQDDDPGEGAAGFGLDVVPTDGRWEVAGVVAGGPAARAGVEIGWTLVTVDSRPPDGEQRFGLDDRATLGFRDDTGRVRTVTLTGEPLPEEPERESRRLEGNVLLMSFPGFEPGIDRWIAGEIATARPAGVILDLRDNDGGESGALDRVAGLFFAERRPVLRLIRRKETVEWTRGAGPDAYLGPLAVLVGPRSASAAEAFAALVDESGRGVTVGERTAGALTGAALYRLPDGGRLSVAEYDVRTPGGRRLEKTGLRPARIIAPTLADRRAGRDPALACAINAVRGRPCPD